jgi:hypothetical protein
VHAGGGLAQHLPRRAVGASTQVPAGCAPISIMSIRSHAVALAPGEGAVVGDDAQDLADASGVPPRLVEEARVADSQASSADGRPAS